MVVLLKGTPFNGTVNLSAIGPFDDEKTAIDWAVQVLEGEPEWFVMEVHSPNEIAMIDDGPGELVDVPIADLERMLADAEKNKKLPKEVLMDLSEIPTGV